MNSSPSSSAVAYALLSALLSVTPAFACGNGTATISEIPTLGGSGFSVYGLNTNAQVTGFAYPSGENATPHAFLAAGPAIQDLGTLGGDTSIGYALNNLGWVTGEAYLETYDSHAFVFDGQEMRDLGTLGSYYSTGIAINDAGQVAGVSITANDTYEAFIYDGTAMHSLGELGGGSSSPVAINDRGSVSGDSATANFVTHAFLFKDGVLNDLGTLGGTMSWARALNNKDQVVGRAVTSNGQVHAFIYTGGETLTDLGTLEGGTYSSATDINDAGHVVGDWSGLDRINRGFIYSGNGLQDLGTLGGNYTIAKAINNAGLVVGGSATSTGQTHAFIWQNGEMTDLNTLLDPGLGWELTTADFLTDNGLISGKGILNGAARYYVLRLPSNNTPPVAVPEAGQAGDCQSLITLDGSNSFDPDGDTLTFEWAWNGSVVSTDAHFSRSYPLGQHTLVLKVTDICGEFSEAAVTVTITDPTAPIVSWPAQATAPANSQCQSAVPDFRLQLTASDNCTATESLVVTQDPAPGTLVSLGTHVVTLRVTDESGNSSLGSVLFTVADQAPPEIALVPSSTIATAENGLGAVPKVWRSVQDGCSQSDQITIIQDPPVGALLPSGQFEVTVTATDASGNRTVGKAGLVIKDLTVPVILGICASPTVLQPPNHQMVPVSVSVSAKDNVDAHPASMIESVTSSEPLAPGDVKVSGPLSLLLAATRNPSGEGRTYTIHVVTVDLSGNRTASTINILVPKGNGSYSAESSKVKVN